MNYKTTASLNVREGPGLDFEILQVLKAGTIVSELPHEGWIIINTPDGDWGWVSAKYLVEAPAEAKVEPVPAVPAGPHLMQSELTRKFGTPKDPAPYLKVMDFKELKDSLSHVKDYEGNPWSCRIYGHELMKAPLRCAFQNLIVQGFAGEWRTYDGCLSIRKMTGGSSYSVHSWGLAIDINAGSNGYGENPSLSAGFVSCFTDCGFEWGGNWHTPDGMHFQWPWVSRRA